MTTRRAILRPPDPGKAGGSPAQPASAIARHGEPVPLNGPSSQRGPDLCAKGQAPESNAPLSGGDIYPFDAGRLKHAIRPGRTAFNGWVRALDGNGDRSGAEGFELDSNALRAQYSSNLIVGRDRAEITII